MTSTAADQDIVWTDDFLIGIDELDYEHRRLIEDINKLHQGMIKHDDMHQIESDLGRIHSRMQAHFALEEHVMKSNNYPYYLDHKKEHDQLLDDYTEFMTKFKGDSNLADRESIEDTLRHWIVGHIIASDKKMSTMVIRGQQESTGLFGRIKALFG